MHEYKFRFNGRVLKFNASEMHEGLAMLHRWVLNRRHRQIKPDDRIEIEAYGHWQPVT